MTTKYTTSQKYLAILKNVFPLLKVLFFMKQVKHQNVLLMQRTISPVIGLHDRRLTALNIAAQLY